MSHAADGFGYPLVDLPPSAIGSPEAAVAYLVEQLVKAGHIQAAYAHRVLFEVLKRESQGSTGIGRGFAIPHTKSNFVSQVVGIVGQSGVPIPWPGTLDGEPVRGVCLLVTPTAAPGSCLRALEAVSRRMRGE